LDGGPTFFGSKGNVSPSGINQQAIGSCWFLAGLAALAERPDRYNLLIEKAHREDSWNNAGIFRFYFHSMGKRIGMNIDERLPTRQMKYTDGTFVPDYFVPYGTTRSDNGAWWVPLIEKAFSKHMQNYDRIQGGSGMESLRILLNKPTFRLVHPDRSDTTKVDEMWKVIHHLHTQDYPATLGCCREQPPDNWATGHAYTLLGTHEVTDANGKSIKLCKVRNPWS
jgi:hypothetical protein